jgi:hypothetical protein
MHHDSRGEMHAPEPGSLPRVHVFGRRTWVRAIFELHEVELRFSL